MKTILTTLTASLMASAAYAAEPLVDNAWLKSNLNDENLVIVDVRSKIDKSTIDTYKASHIPGAVYSNYLEDGWRTKDANGTPGQLPEPAQLEALFEKLGISNTSHVIIIPAGKTALDMGSATRAYWTLKVSGHDEVSILDGGFAGWAADASNPVETGVNQPKPGEFTVTLRSELIASKEDVKAATQNKISLVDNRPTNQFSGSKKHKLSARFGTIPGAVNIPEGTLTENGGGSFRNANVLKSLYGATGTDVNKDEINFCNTGHWASLGWFVSHELVGNKKAKLYDGSMVEWTADKSLPLVKTAN